MKIVIDINENEYLGIKNYPNNTTSYPVTIHLYEAVKKGISLPKGHGRLIDASCEVSSDGRTIDSVCGYVAPTIIEADKE